MKIRTAALLAFATAAPHLALSIWSSANQQLAVSPSAQHAFILIWLVVSAIVTASLPAFYYVLSAYDGALPVRRPFRAAALGAALALILTEGASLPGALRRLAPASVLGEAQAVRTFAIILTVLSLLSTLALVVLLFVLARQPDPEDGRRTPVSKPLRLVTTFAVFVWGIWVFFNLIRLLATPYTYAQLRQFAAATHRTLPPFLYFLADTARAFLTQACLWVAPVVVWRSIRGPLPEPPAPAPEEAVTDDAVPEETGANEPRDATDS